MSKMKSNISAAFLLSDVHHTPPFISVSYTPPLPVDITGIRSHIFGNL